MDYRKKQELYSDLYCRFQIGWWLDIYTRAHENFYKWDDVRARLDDDSKYYRHALKNRNRYKQVCDFCEERILQKHDDLLEYLMNSFNIEIDFEKNKATIK